MLSAAKAAPAVPMPSAMMTAAMGLSVMGVLLASERPIEVDVAQPGLEGAHLAFGLVAREAVLLLDLAHELVALAVDDVELVVRQLAPLFFDLALELLPVAFDAIPIHCETPCVV